MFAYFLPKVGNKAKVFTLTTCIQDFNGCSSQCNKARKRNKRYADQKGRNKTLLLDDMILCVENPKGSTQKNKIKNKTKTTVKCY